MEFSILINWTNPFPAEGLFGGIFFKNVFQIFIGHSVSKYFRQKKARPIFKNTEVVALFNEGQIQKEYTKVIR